MGQPYAGNTSGFDVEFTGNFLVRESVVHEEFVEAAIGPDEESLGISQGQRRWAPTPTCPIIPYSHGQGGPAGREARPQRSTPPAAMGEFLHGSSRLERLQAAGLFLQSKNGKNPLNYEVISS